MSHSSFCSKGCKGLYCEEAMYLYMDEDSNVGDNVDVRMTDKGDVEFIRWDFDEGSISVVLTIEDKYFDRLYDILEKIRAIRSKKNLKE